jgi:hypothetical protein
MQGYDVQQSTTAYPLVFLLISSVDHLTGLTGATVAVTLSKSGGAFGSPAGAVSEIGSGWYKVAGNATDTGTLGPLALHATATGADPSDALYPVVAYSPQDAVHLGLSAIPNTACTTNASLLTSGSGTDQISAAAGKLLLQPTQAGVTIPTVTTVGTLTTYTGNTVQTGDSYARIGSTGSSLTSLAPAATALSTATWTNTLAGYLANLSGGAVALASTALSTAQWTNTRASNLDNLDAAVSTRSTYAGGAVASVTGAVTVGTNADKTGYALASTGLDSIGTTAPSGAATTFPLMLVQVWRRFFKGSAKAVSSLTIKTFANDGTTVLTTQAYTDDGAGNETLGSA